MRRGNDKEKARQVVHHLGTNSIPLLLDWLKMPDRPSPGGRAEQIKFGVISWLERHRILKPRSQLWKMDWKGSYRSLAQSAFEELGADGQSAIPRLVDMLAIGSDNTNQINETASAASLTLSRMAPYSIPALIKVAGSTNDFVYALAAMALGLIGPDAKAAIPAIQKRFKDPRPEVRIGAAEIVSKLGGEPSQFMPIVIDAMREIDLTNLGWGTELLRDHKQEAKSAIPILKERLSRIPASTTNLNEIAASDVLKGLLHELTSRQDRSR